MIKLQSLRAAKFKQLDDVSLAFPTRGSVLVQGLNEAGKSTLFESVFFALFGKGLVTEDNAGKLDDLINYQSPRALVQLAFSTDSANFVVGRGLNRAKANTATLDIEYASGKRETVTNLTSVNRRIVDELGLDGEALLNSCFVEQKKLEKLEAMSAQQRRDILLRLLNLDKLSVLEANYKPTSADDFQLQQARDRLKLAEVQRDLPAVVSRLTAVEGELRLIRGLRLCRQIAELDTTVRGERERQAVLEAEAGRLAAALSEVERVKDVRDLARQAGEMLLAIGEDMADVERLQRELSGLQAQAARLPELQAEQERFERLAADLAQLAQRQEEQAQRQRSLDRVLESVERVASLNAAVEERRQSLADLRQQIAQVQRDVEAAEEVQRRARQAGLLRGWLQIREVALIAQEGERELGLLRQKISDLDRRAAECAVDRRVKQRTMLGLGLGVASSLVLVVALAVGGMLYGLFGLPVALGLAAAWWRARASHAAALEALVVADKAVAEARVFLNRREGEQALAQRTGQDASRLADLERDITAIGLAVPATVAEAQAAIAELGVPESGEDVASGAERQRLGALQGQRLAIETEMGDLATKLEQEGDATTRRQELEGLIAAEAAAIEAQRSALSEEATDNADAREQAAAARAACAAATDADKRAADLEVTLSGRRERLAQRGVEFEGVWQRLAAARPGTEQDVDACRAVWRQAGEALAALDEPKLRREAAQAGSDLAASQERGLASERAIAVANAELQALHLEEQELNARGSGEEDLDVNEAALAQEQRDLLGRVAALQDRQVALEQQLGLQGVAVEYAQAETELADVEDRLLTRKQAFRIVSLARRNIVGKVLPSTVRNMGLLLPLLTNDRYRDVEIDPETYKIRVWDEAARAMKAKDIFSGGTRDQFSLALRLAFALATLPEELGTAPGFIFLDEPLSSFDSTRGGALVNLLTRGVVAANFEQIFVISHNRAFDESLFDYHLHVDAGQIVASDLPAAERPAAAEPEQHTLALATAG